MRKSTSLFFKSFYEYVPLTEVADLPKGMRGIYALYQEDGVSKNLMYVGMTAGGAKGRLGRHSGGKKTGLWSHCSVFEVWDNITEEQIDEKAVEDRNLYLSEDPVQHFAQSVVEGDRWLELSWTTIDAFPDDNASALVELAR